MDYYEILELRDDCNEHDIKKQYHNLSKIYHPDKNNGDDSHFKIISEAYDILSNNEKRKVYDLKRIFKNVEFTEEEFQYLLSYYQKFIESKEYRLMKLLYNSIPPQLKVAIWNKFKSFNKKDIIPSLQAINIENLEEDTIINLGILKENKSLKKLKIILIHTKYGTLPLCLRNYEIIYINNINCYLTLKFFIRT
tara:strand:+ start:1226 stop:1807 length:582 start_codon:yes stop_codon:yes gene_type:complete